MLSKYIHWFFSIIQGKISALKISAVCYSTPWGARETTDSRKWKRQYEFYGDMKMMKAIDSLRTSKIQNLPFNSEIPNVGENADNYS